MAGGKERVLRRRIKSVQTTKKITKAMELIAASRIVKSQQRVLAARPYADQITEVIRNLAAAGAGGGAPLLAQRESRSTPWPPSSSAATADCAVATTATPSAWPSATRPPSAARASSTVLIAVGKKVESLLPVPQVRHRGLVHRLPRRAHLRRRSRHRRVGRPQVRGRHLRPGRHRLHAVPVGRHPEGRHPPVPAARHLDHHRGRPTSPDRPPTTSSSPAPTPSSTACCPATPRPACSRPCSRVRPASSPPSSGP